MKNLDRYSIDLNGGTHKMSEREIERTLQEERDEVKVFRRLRKYLKQKGE